MTKYMAYTALVAESAAVGWPEAHRGDLTEHDRSALRAKPEFFVWALRKCGTWLILPAPGCSGLGSVEWLETIDKMERTGGLPNRWYIWGNGKLRETKAHIAIREMAAAVRLMDRDNMTVHGFDSKAHGLALVKHYYVDGPRDTTEACYWIQHCKRKCRQCGKRRRAGMFRLIGCKKNCRTDEWIPVLDGPVCQQCIAQFAAERHIDAEPMPAERRRGFVVLATGFLS